MASTTAVNRIDDADPVEKPRWYRQLYFWVIVAIVAGVLVGWLAPGFGKAMEPIGSTFVAAMRMLIGPIVFLTIIGGIAGVADLKKVGLTGVKALVYFQVGTLLALATGLLAINLIPVGEGVNADTSQIEVSETVSGLIDKAENQHWWDFLTHIIPTTMASAFVEGDILQIIFLAVIVGVALNALGPIAAPLLDLVQRGTKVMFKILSYIMKLAPLGAFGAMAYAIGKYGISTLVSLGSLIGLFYATSAVFVFVVLGSVMAYLKFNIFKLFRYLKEELLLIIGTSTAEPALPGLMRKLEHAGVKRSVVGLVVPTGYSFNLDGAAIYLSLAAVYLAQATGTNLTLSQQLGLMAIMLLTSKGAAGVAGGGFIALAATLSTVGTIPPAAIMLIFGIDKFMSECRAVVNFVGNAVATLFVGKWDRAVDSDRVRRVLDREPVPALPAELDATTNPLAVESTKLDDEYHPHLHHEHHAPQPRYRVDDEVRRLGPDAHTHPAPVVGDASEPSPVLAGTGAPAASVDGDAGPGSASDPSAQQPTGRRR
jgi:aerobic C4-dicarboxylate transport protein